MSYDKKLPPMWEIYALTQQLIFPASRNEVIEEAQEIGSDEKVIDLISYFPDDEQFESRKDFIDRCDELIFLIREERKSEHQFLNKSQE